MLIIVEDINDNEPVFKSFRSTISVREVLIAFLYLEFYNFSLQLNFISFSLKASVSSLCLFVLFMIKAAKL